MLCINTNGNDIAPKALERTIANRRANPLIKKPNIANNIFIAIRHANPSILQQYQARELNRQICTQNLFRISKTVERV